MNSSINNILNTNAANRICRIILVCLLFGLITMLAACGSGDDDEDSTNGGTTIEIDWENDQIIVEEVSSGGYSGDILTTPVRSLNESGELPSGWELTRIGTDNDNNDVADVVYTYQYDSDGYLERKLTYSDLDVNGDPINENSPDEVVEYNVDDGVLDEIEYDTDGDGVTDRIVDYAYDTEGRIDDEEIYNSSSKTGDPDEIWQYDYDPDEDDPDDAAFLKERYLGGFDEVSEEIVYNEYGDIIKISADPDESGDFQSIIDITPTYNNFGNIATTTTIFDIGGVRDTEVVTYRYTYDDTSGNLLSYEADDGDSTTTDPTTSFTWIQN